MFTLIENSLSSITENKSTTKKPVIKRRRGGALTTLLATTMTLCSIYAEATINDRNFTLLNWGSDWTESSLFQNPHDTLQVSGHGQWQCWVPHNPNSNNQTEYDAGIRQTTYAHAYLNPNWERDCAGWPTERYRNFNLRLLVQQWNGAGWVTEYDNLVSWPGQWADHIRSLEHYAQSDGKRYNIYAATQVEGSPWMYGFIDFIDN